MRIALYHPWIYLKSGLERTLFEMKRRSRHDITLFTSHYDAAGTYPEFREMGVTELERVPVNRRYGAVLRAAWTIATSRIDMDRFDALVVSCDGLGSLFTLRNATKPSACLCFTPLRAVYDEEYRRRHRSRHAAMLPLVHSLEAGYRLLDRALWRRYGEVVAISRTVRDRIVAGGLAPPERIAVAHPGIAAERIRLSPVREPFFFLPGRIMWTKNIELGIEAFLRFRDRTPEGARFRLIVAGMMDEKSRPYLERLRALAGDTPAVEFVLNPTDAEMAELYWRCYGLLFTAFNEDWGMTPIEGMAHGKPVVAVDRGGPRETVTSGENGLLVPDHPDAFAGAMDRLAGDPAFAERLGLNGLERARRFTWPCFVDEFDGRMEALVAAGGRTSAPAVAGSELPSPHRV